MIMERKQKWKKPLIFIGFVILIFIGNAYFGWSDYFRLERLQSLQSLAMQNFWLAFFVYTILTIIGCVVLALPGILFAVAAGIIFEPILGIFACLFATTLGAMFAFLVGRFFLKDAVKPMLDKNQILKKLLFEADARNEFILLMITRMVPIFPYNLQNFAYGITNIGFWKYSILTFVFMLPGIAFFTIGSAGIVASANQWQYFLSAALLAILVTAAGLYIQKKFLNLKCGDVNQ